ncbi:MAG: diaminopimelate decarboxylase [Candidatus Symbiobacter sp.]|nr:diaminopimelate decarboxylase [Candidatus Symbiobacter sp.]
MSTNPAAPPPGFYAQNGQFFCEGVAMTDLAAQFGTPSYVYSAALMRQAWQNFHRQVTASLSPAHAPLICFAVKANPNLAVLRLFAALGAGADIVSSGELQRALKAGITAEKIVFAGVGKRDDEIAAALDHGILQFSVESVEELQRIAALAAAKNVTARAAIRVNPDIDGGTHAKISTGNKHNKFGIEQAQVAEIFAHARQLPSLQLDGLSVHIGSQLTELKPLALAFAALRQLVLSLRQSGHRLTRLDLGGGIGVSYRGEKLIDLAAYAALVNENVGDLGCRLIFEPGRFLVAKAGILLTRVIATKANSSRNFVILDAAMNDLMRPALYDSYHDIVPVVTRHAPPQRVDVVGPVCESADIFAEHRHLPPLTPGDLVMIADTGAYGASMSNSYNSRHLPAEIMVEDSKARLVRRAISTLDLLQFEPD